MNNIKAITYTALAILSSLGCSAAGDDEGAYAEPVVESQAPASEKSDELARIEFDDGNVVRFEALNGGVLVSELGPELNPRRLSPGMARTALDAYKALAPGREIPARLLQMHDSMHSQGDLYSEQVDSSGSESNVSSDPDVTHDGDFQQALPAASFLAEMCNFPTGNGSYKHTDRTDTHTDASLDINAAYYAVGSDSGTLTAQACVGENAGGFFDGDCGGAVSVTAGARFSGFYDAGEIMICHESDGFGCELFGCVDVCVVNTKRFELNYVKLSPTVNFHECFQKVIN